MHEDVVIGALADRFRAEGAIVLAEGGNQMRAFRFITSTGRRKAPDLAAYSSGVLALFEAKVRGRALFRPAKDGLCDYQVVAEICSNPMLVEQLLEEAARRLRACGSNLPKPSTLKVGLIATTPIVSCEPALLFSGVMAVQVNVADKTYLIENPASGPVFAVIP